MSRAMSAVTSCDRPSRPSASRSITFVHDDFSSRRVGRAGRQDSLPCDEITFDMSEMARKICATDVKGEGVLGSFPERESSS